MCRGAANCRYPMLWLTHTVLCGRLEYVIHGTGAASRCFAAAREDSVERHWGLCAAALWNSLRCGSLNIGGAGLACGRGRCCVRHFCVQRTKSEFYANKGFPGDTGSSGGLTMSCFDCAVLLVVGAALIHLRRGSCPYVAPSGFGGRRMVSGFGLSRGHLLTHSGQHVARCGRRQCRTPAPWLRGALEDASLSN